MSSDSLDNCTSPGIRQNSSGNNQLRLSDDEEGQKTLFSQLNEAEKETLLHNVGFLHGILVNGKEGPRRSTRQLVKLKDSEQQLPNSIQECNNVITEVVSTKNLRDANFAHQGWSASAISTSAPWIASRIVKSNQTLKEDLCITKQIVVQRLIVNVSLQDLEPAPKFEKDVLDALGKPSRTEKFQALDQVFQLWGDVIPMAFDLGHSLSTTDIQANFDQASDQNDPNELHNLIAFKTGRISTQGGEGNFLPGGDAKAWIGRAVPTQLWSQVRLTQVIPTTCLLTLETNEKLVDLYSTLLSYRPPLLDKPAVDCKVFDGGPHVLKTISSLVIHANSSHVLGISVVYLDGTNSGEHGDCVTKEPVFILNNGEHIVEVTIWTDVSCVYGLQFTTSDGRISPHYGGTAGTPTIMSSEDGVLVAFSGLITSNLFYRLQTVWRHDVVKTKSSQKGKYFEYVGGSDGEPFTDWPYSSFSTSAYISSINIKSTDHIISIQIIYADSIAGEVIYAEGPVHGGEGGTENSFKLDPGEHIVGVQGRQDKQIYQLFFTTNFGRTSDIYGGNAGNPFKCEPPRKQSNKPMRLSYIAGKCGSALEGALFVWVPM